MCDKAILENVGTLKYVPGCYKNEEVCNKAIENNTLMHLNLFLNAIRLKKCMIKLLILILLQLNVFLNAIRHKKCVIELFIDAFLCLIQFLISIKLKKY